MSNGNLATVDERADDGVPSIALIGPGAIGTTIAALLHDEGHAVVLCGRTPRPSLQLRPGVGDPTVVPGPVHTDPAAVTAPVRLVLPEGPASDALAEVVRGPRLSIDPTPTSSPVPLLAAASDGPG